MKKGFTLIELLAVIIILAILMIVAVPNVLQTLNDAKKSTFATQAQSLFSAAEQKWVLDSMTGSPKDIYTTEVSGAALDLSTIGDTVKYCVQLDPTTGHVKRITVDDGTYRISETTTTGLAPESVNKTGLAAVKTTVYDTTNTKCAEN